MQILERINTMWQELFKRRRISVHASRDNREVWYTHISTANIFMVFVSTLLLLFIVVLTLVGYTNLMSYLPGYRDDASRERERIVEQLVKIDSLEQVIGECILYTENVGVIMSGKTPRIYENLSIDTMSLTKRLTLPNAMDSLLRREMEGSGRYSLQLASYYQGEPMTAPTDGIVHRGFNPREGLFNIEITAPEGRVMATHRGVVSLVVNSALDNYTLQIIHPDDKISTYQRLATTTLKRGDTVVAGDIVGDNGGQPTLLFELWADGRVVDPENYINF